MKPWTKTTCGIGLLGALLLPAIATATETTPREGFDAAALFKASCAPCHGLSGAGDGPVASVLASEVPRLDDLTKRAEGVYPADYVREVIDGRSEIGAHGTREMPVWGLRFERLYQTPEAPGTEADAAARASAEMLITGLVDYIRTLQAE
jgi:mono/diheme cytochrome c family protein